jgi:hypothetical protein
MAQVPSKAAAQIGTTALNRMCDNPSNPPLDGEPATLFARRGANVTMPPSGDTIGAGHRYCGGSYVYNIYKQ